MERSFDFTRLKRCSFFGGLTEHAFNSITPFIRREELDSNYAVITEGAVNDRLYFIESGSVSVTKRRLGGAIAGALTLPEEEHLVDFGPGETFGEMELIDIQPCAATVRTLEKTVLLSLSNRDLYKVSKTDMKTYALLMMNLARDLSRRLRDMDTRLVSDQ